MTIPGSDVPPEDDHARSLEQFRTALASEVGRASLGIDISHEEAASILADRRLSASWYKRWQMSVREHPSGVARDVAPATSSYAG